MSNSQMEALDFRYLLLEYYKKLRISENELSVLLMINHLLEQKNTLITPDLLSLKMTLSVNELDKILVGLMDRGLVVFDVGKKMKVSLKPLEKKLCDCFKNDLSSDNEYSNESAKSEALKKTIEVFEEEFQRQLSPLEKNTIQNWLSKGYKDTLIIDALKDCVDKNLKTIKEIDKLLLQWQTREDYEKAGFSATSDKWDKNIEDTMKIAKAKWIDD